MGILDYFRKNNVTATATSSKRVNPQIVKIIEGFKDRSRKDIDKWRQALKLTQLVENPIFDTYHDLVDDLLTDGHLQSQIQMRISATLNTNFHIVNRKTGEENEDLTFVFQQQWFYEFIEQYLWHIIRGYKLMQFRSFEGEKIDLKEIPQRHLVPTRTKIIPDLSNREVFIDYSDESLKQWLLTFGKTDSLGLINNIVPAIIWKRNVEQSWAEFCERFGIPLITATTSSRDESKIDEVHDMLIGIGEASVGTFPQGTEITIHEANRTDAYNTYKQFIQLNMDSISKQLVGSTMLSDQGSNRSQTEVHERSLDEKIATMDKRGLRFMVNDQLLPLLQEHGYNVSEDDVFEFKTAEQKVAVKELWDITNGLLTQGYEPKINWLEKTFNIPLEGKKELTPQPIGEKKKPKLNAIFSRYPESCCTPISAINSSISKKLIKLTEQLAGAIFDKKEVLGILGKLIATEGNELAKGMMQGFGTDKTYTGQDKLVMQLMEYNCFDFACSKVEERHFAVSSRLLDYKKGKLKSRSEFIQECLKDNEQLNTNWLKTEYDLAVATGQNSANYIRFVKEAKDGGTRFYEYQTMGDDLVRPAHSILDGKVFDILEAEDKVVYPPNGHGCRCELIPHSGGVKITSWGDAKGLLMANDKRYESSQFVINRGDLKQVFTKKQFYKDVKGYPEKINQMTFDKYGLKKWSEFKNKLKNIKVDKTINGDNINELFKETAGENRMGFSDYLGRKMYLRKKSFKKHTKGYYLNGDEMRDKLFPKIKDVLNNPDEVWLNNYIEKAYNTSYIKYYKDKTLIVECSFDKNNGVELKTWYLLKRDEKNIRKGILIKNQKVTN